MPSGSVSIFQPDRSSAVRVCILRMISKVASMSSFKQKPKFNSVSLRTPKPLESESVPNLEKCK